MQCGSSSDKKDDDAKPFETERLLSNSNIDRTEDFLINLKVKGSM